MVGVRSYPVAAAVYAEICWKCDGGAEPEEDVQSIEDDAHDWNMVAIEERGREEVEERQHSENAGEHDIVDHG